ncbi:MAG: twin-arginine translocase TatA/TatE family subunit [Candidatus Yonathbacteria bacterium]|nr:twin-arginine translocase TatA/TatE family subunit [Candidatus Yonathbacteria bacterium]
MFDLGTKEVLIIIIVIILLFGSEKIPELTKAIGDASRNIIDAFKGHDPKK